MTAPFDWRSLLTTLPYNGAPTDLSTLGPLPNFVPGTGPPMTPMSMGTPPAGGAVGGAGASTTPPAPQGPDFFERLRNGLFPTAASPLASILNPQELQALRSRALLGLGANFLARSGPRPVGTSSVLSDIGQSLGAGTQGWPGMLEGAASQAFQLNQLALQAKQRQAVQDFISQHPLPENASPSDVRQWVAQAIPAFLASGNEAGVAQLGPLMTGLEGGTPSFEKGTYQGRPALMRVAKDGTATPVIGPDGQPVQPTEDEATLIAKQNAVVQGTATRLDNETKDYQDVINMARQGLSQAAAARSGDGAAQYTLLDNFVRFSNPKGVARVGNLELVRDAQSYLQKAQALGQNVMGGKAGLLPPSFVDQIISTMRGGVKPVLSAWQQRYEGALRQTRAAKIPDSALPFDPPPDPSEFADPNAVVTPNPGGPHSRAAAKALGH